ncbi:competence type IV pilus major pilin ComGC [Candidatus Enterococcus ikei]|uniref:competence type IV pilus major pilin ComGC n=1 Tax=Candidatus Enterococcus ikei TaxID=2815326 RepID=UPI003D320310
MNRIKKKKKINYSGFTLLEMLVVLLIISVLVLLFVPNLSKHKEGVDKKGNEAIVKIVETQIDLYIMEKNQTPTMDQLVKEQYITQEQYDKYQASKK